MKQRLANKKTKSELGLDHVISGMELLTPFGRKGIKEKEPFFPGEEELLRKELDQVQRMLELLQSDRASIDALREIFMEMKDNSFTISRSADSVLSAVELFEIKNLLLQTERIRQILAALPVPEEFVLEDTQELLDVLDPRKDRLASFYIYDEFSIRLKELREKKRQLERRIRKENKAKKDEIKEKYGVSLTPKFEITAAKADEKTIKMIYEIQELQPMREDYLSVTFSLKQTAQVRGLMEETEELNGLVEEEEYRTRQRLSRKIGQWRQVLTENCQRLGELDITLSKAIYAQKHKCVKPRITEEHRIEFEDGRHLKAEEALAARGREYCPISVKLEDGVTCITGANMGGKTVSLKLVGLVAILAQYGFFVPCESAIVGLSNYTRILIGDSQSVERGLSSFGGEMEELRGILENSAERSLLLIDEIASGTNPAEGMALTRSLVDYLKPRAYISLITTHFETAAEDPQVNNLQVIGLAEADFTLLDRELKYAGRRQRVEIISKYMDYRLKRVEEQREIPRDALNIAGMLGISSDIIERAKGYLK
ncbi:hypothetical protein LI177_11655 [bacterium 210820-DFI.6.37]|nr:hypothetical protein [bacterium 210820-DFI.6.37]